MKTFSCLQSTFRLGDSNFFLDSIIKKLIPNKNIMNNFKFLVTTDNHLGFKDDDHLRANDSYNAFEEALQVARDRDVDFILLGGDLFHVNKPSASVEHKCIKIIRQHMNSSFNKTSFKKIAGSFSHCPSLLHPNFEDSNLNVAQPILTIHGNHDDPTGPNNQSVCEKLATSGLLNYFGFVSLKSNRITVEPIVLVKDDITLAIYGMGFLPDARLRTAFERKEVEFKKPPKDAFNVLVTHQNRASVNKDRFIPDDYYPEFFDLIIRGHEHESQSPQKMPGNEKCIVYQPGSTVPTSINVMESLPKKVGIVEVSRKQKDKQSMYNMKIDLVELKSIRPMIVKNIYRNDILEYGKKTKQLKKQMYQDCIWQDSKAMVNEALKEALKETKDSKILPLVRIRVEYSERDEKFDDGEITMENYSKTTANKDIVLFRKQKIIEDEGDEINITFKEFSSLVDIVDDDDVEHINLSQEKKNTIDAMIESYFENLDLDHRLVALSLKEYTEAVSSALEDGNVIGKVVKAKTDQTMKEFEKVLSSEDIAEEHFLEEEPVKKWFIKKLKSQNVDFVPKVGGDIMIVKN